MKWLKKGIEIQIMFDKDQTGRGLTLLGVAMKFMNDLEKAEEVFKRAGIILKGVKNM